MKKNAFTLIELLAIIVVIGMIALISSPIILGVLEDSRKKVFETDTKTIEREIIRYVTQNGGTGTFIINDGTVTLDGKNTDVQSGKGYYGTIIVDDDGYSSFAIHNHRWCALKENQGNIEIIDYEESTCKIEE